MPSQILTQKGGIAIVNRNQITIKTEYAEVYHRGGNRLMSESITDRSEYQYHANIHRDEESYRDEIDDRYTEFPINKSVSLPEMKLSANFNKIETFAISSVDTSNVTYFMALFKKLDQEAKVSNHQLTFPGLDDLSDHVAIFNGVQYDIIELLLALQSNSPLSQHKQIVKISI